MKADSTTLMALANELSLVAPMTREQYVKVIRLYAYEPWRLQPAIDAMGQTQ